MEIIRINPGPWKRYKVSGNMPFGIQSTKTNEVIAFIKPAAYCENNAKVIAAAPVLYETLLKVLNKVQEKNSLGASVKYTTPPEWQFVEEAIKAIN